MPLEIWPPHLAPQYVELVAKHQDLLLHGVFETEFEDDELEEATKTSVEEGQENEVTRLGLHGAGRIRHLASSLMTGNRVRKG